jgi:hypothetical protein
MSFKKFKENDHVSSNYHLIDNVHCKFLIATIFLLNYLYDNVKKDKSVLKLQK